MVSLSYAFRVGQSTVLGIILETCLALYDTLKKTYLPLPTTEMFKKAEEGFRTKWNMPHCVTASDGKHVVHQVKKIVFQINEIFVIECFVFKNIKIT